MGAADGDAGERHLAHDAQRIEIVHHRVDGQHPPHLRRALHAYPVTRVVHL